MAFNFLKKQDATSYQKLLCCTTDEMSREWKRVLSSTKARGETYEALKAEFAESKQTFSDDSKDWYTSFIEVLDKGRTEGID